MHKNFKILFLFFLISFVETNSQENSPQNFTTSDGLPDASINDITQDEIGYLWLATDKGYTKFDGDKFTNYTQEKANCIFMDKGKIYIGLTNGLVVHQHNKTSFFECKEILKIKLINNKIILATVQGISEFKENYIQPIKINTAIDFAIINDVQYFKNKLYVSSIKGLWSLDTIYKPKKITKIANDNYLSFLVNKNNLIAITLNNLHFIKENTIVNEINTLENSISISKINNNLWITSKEDGIVVLDANTYTFKRNINKYNSAISNKVNVVFKDNQNSIWIASKNKGLHKYNSINKTIKTNVYIENITVNYKKIDSLNTRNLKLKPTENNISFTFKTIDLKNAKNIQYRYKLKDVFSPWTHQNKIDFANLKAGKYTFTVQSKIGKTLSKKVSFSFSIATPIYKKMWFLVLSGVLLCILLAAFIDLHIRKLNKKNQQKVASLKTANHILKLEQKALQLQMNPHFIFNVLNGIKALGNSEKPKKLNKTISQFSILLRSVLNNSRLEEISLKDEIETLKNFIELEQQMNATPFEYNIETILKNIDSEEILIPPMLLQPFVENCIKHAFLPNTKTPKIKIIFEVKHNFLYFLIEDNGIGYYQSKQEKVKTNHQSVALEVTKERIQYLTKYNSFSIEEIKKNQVIAGTKIEFKIPLKTDY